jgi:hypothetical protein
VQHVVCTRLEKRVLGAISKIYTQAMPLFVSYTDYLVGRQSGVYAPHSNPIYISKNEPSLIDKITDAYCKEIGKECARQAFHPTLLKQQQKSETLSQ